jgi:hypothetical protein
MTTARAAIAVVLAAAVVVATALLLRDRPSSPDRSADRASDERPAGSSKPLAGAARAAERPSEARPAPSANPSAGADSVLDEFERVVASGYGAQARAEARDLRRLLRTDRAALERAIARLLRPGLSSDVRSALAFVLGTLPGEAGTLADRALIDAVRLFASDTAFVRCALLALGAQREPAEDDDVFGLGDRPHGVLGPLGLGITVRREIPDRPPGPQELLIDAFGAGKPEIREAAARSLGSSMASPGPRTVFIATLGSEPSDEVAAAIGEPLAEWASGVGAAVPEAEREAAVGALVSRLGEPGFDTYRFQLENSFERLPLTAAQRSDLARLAGPARTFAIRSFAISALIGSVARRPSVETVNVVRRTLLLATADADPAIRDLAARGLGTLPQEAATSAALASLVRNDTAWNVRFTAMESFMKVAPRDDGLALLRAAKGDADSRVAERAAELLAQKESVR